ncbi:MAG: AzlC family ABC transporter permease [Clostridia bacterium]|nr:AzlC family ABC transporter permease [Clostridia bacterium]
MSKRQASLRALRAAFPHTIPILTGFGFLGITYGIFMSAQGFSALYPFLISLTVFGGSLQFIAVNLLLDAFNPIQAFAVSLMIQARHLFYGIAMLDRYKNTGWKKPYLIFGLCDESFSINYTAKIPEGVDRGWFMFWVTLLNQTYWVIGSAVGGIAGNFIPFNTEGIDFVMTAMFVVILIEQLKKEKRPYTALIGLVASLICLVAFGADSFLIPAMLIIILALTAGRRFIEPSLDMGEPFGGESL